MRHLVWAFLAGGTLLGCSVSAVGSMDPVDGGRCDTPMETTTLSDGCTVCTCDGQTWSCDGAACTKTTECVPGELRPNERGDCYDCICNDTGHWECPIIECEGCAPGEMHSNECYSCVCNDRRTWTCTGDLDGNCGAEPCAEGTADCNGTMADGCEANLTSSTVSCGFCNNVCMAAPGETAVCVTGACQRLIGENSCQYGGVDHAVGETFPSRDGCNTCTCVEHATGIGIACSTNPCMCDPEAETNYRRYLTNGIDPCMTFPVLPCTEFTTPFTNECGCGCEQGVECPSTYVCPENGCMEVRSRCPFTEYIVP